MEIRHITLADAPQLMSLFTRLDAETHFMLYEQDERNATLESTEKMITTFMKKDNIALFVIEEDNQLVGQLGVMGGTVNRNKHSAYIAVGIRQDYTGRGYGSQLFQAVDEWAKEVGITRLDLTVMVHNTHAISLYKKVGFTVIGTRTNSLIVDGNYVDELHMEKLL